MKSRTRWRRSVFVALLAITATAFSALFACGSFFGSNDAEARDAASSNDGSSSDGANSVDAPINPSTNDAGFPDANGLSIACVSSYEDFSTDPFARAVGGWKQPVASLSIMNAFGSSEFNWVDAGYIQLPDGGGTSSAWPGARNAWHTYSTSVLLRFESDGGGPPQHAVLGVMFTDSNHPFFAVNVAFDPTLKDSILDVYDCADGGACPTKASGVSESSLTLFAWQIYILTVSVSGSSLAVDLAPEEEPNSSALSTGPLIATVSPLDAGSIVLGAVSTPMSKVDFLRVVVECQN